MYIKILLKIVLPQNKIKILAYYIQIVFISHKSGIIVLYSGKKNRRSPFCFCEVRLFYLWLVNSQFAFAMKYDIGSDCPC